MSGVIEAGGNYVTLDSTGYEIDTITSGKTIKFRTNSTTRINITDDIINATPNRIIAQSHFSPILFVTASGTLVQLSRDSSFTTYITGSVNQTIRLPDTSTLTIGQTFKIINRATNLLGSAPIQTFAGTAVTGGGVAVDTAKSFLCISTSVNTPAAWDNLG
jgi:hypothetical protein